MKFVCQFKRQLFLSGFTTQQYTTIFSLMSSSVAGLLLVATQAKARSLSPQRRCHLPLAIIVAILAVADLGRAVRGRGPRSVVALGPRLQYREGDDHNTAADLRAGEAAAAVRVPDHPRE